MKALIPLILIPLGFVIGIVLYRVNQHYKARIATLQNTINQKEVLYEHLKNTIKTREKIDAWVNDLDDNAVRDQLFKPTKKDDPTRPRVLSVTFRDQREPRGQHDNAQTDSQVQRTKGGDL